ncbi:MAG: glycosyltransferase family 4 protein [Candidatus Eremiobacteraeota bacterium]|nr:glycosyltransferase family 4 protein [Candidatus Eremiobacteraeota bacterium]
MKIGLFTNAYHPTINGVVSAVSLLYRGMKELGHSVYIFAPGFKGYSDDGPDIYRFWSVNPLPKNKFPLAIPFHPGLIGMITRMNLDIIHTHHPFLLGKLGAKLARRLKIPLIYTFHTQFERYVHYVPLLPEKLATRITRSLIIKYLRNCDTVLCPSPTVLPLLEDYGVTSEVEVIPNPVDLSSFGNADGKPVREKYGISRDEKLLIYVGRLGKEKSLPELFRAFKEIQETYPSSKLMIVGEGPYKEPLEEDIKNLELDKKIILTGRVEPGEIPPYYAAADIYVMTSTSEVKPLALLEAMASGLPVIAVKGPGATDTITNGEDGILVDGPEDDFVSAVINFLNNPELTKKMGNNARANSRKYNYLNIAEKTIRAYNKAMLKIDN